MNYSIAFDSPIEKKLLAAIIIDFNACLRISGLGNNIYHFGNESPEVDIECQKNILNYRVDFFITIKERIENNLQQFAPLKLIIECDGHDFHERTKEQAARDKKRDRRLQQLGFPILRFTGSEIYKNPFCCVNQIMDFYAIWRNNQKSANGE